MSRLHKFDYRIKDNRKRNIILVGISILTIIVIGIKLYNSYAKFEVTSNAYDAFNGTVNFPPYLYQKILTDNGGIEEIENKETPDFSKAAVSQNYYDSLEDKTNYAVENGMWSMEDDYGTSYYFRGATINNYLMFGGYCWRIVRINGDNSIRIVYQGNTCDRKSSIAYSKINENTDDNAYIGYMYGTPNSNNYNDTHENKNDSDIKIVVDNWYENNLIKYERYISDEIFCNDRSLIEGQNTNDHGYATINTTYSFRTRASSRSPNLSCNQKNDAFTVDDEINGNSSLLHPIALLTGDELMLAGATSKDYVDSNTGYPTDMYLSGGSYYYWTMTPIGFTGANYIYFAALFSDGRLNTGQSGLRTHYSIRVIPVVNLKSTIYYKSGNGSLSSPYLVGPQNINS